MTTVLHLCDLVLLLLVYSSISLATLDVEPVSDQSYAFIFAVPSIRSVHLLVMSHNPRIGFNLFVYSTQLRQRWTTEFKMKVEMVVDPSKVPPKPLSTRLNPAPAVTAPTAVR
ncbi:hypothetical protein BT69DRAFT_546078 [Atractiella rhizophila]|nr:hypothetical protein BT69DRAFT_546078 [Atractiella rhizophila]